MEIDEFSCMLGRGPRMFLWS